MKSEKGLYDRLTSVAHLLRHLHDHTASDYRKQEEFAYFHKILDQLRLSRSAREQYNRLLGDWWYSTVLDRHHGSMIHNDANPMNYVFDGDRVYALDFESSRKHANPVHDLGIIAAELKHYFAMHKGDDRKAEPYIGHFMWQYSRGEDDFRRITRIVPFFMSLGLLRMARLWLDHNDNSYIFREAYACLKAKP
jgi:thiamine kinase-like enzyme